METLSRIEKQEGLNEVVINKVHNMIELNAASVTAVLQRLIYEGKIAKDYLAPIGRNLRSTNRNPEITFSANGHVQMNMQNGTYSLNNNAVSQLGEKLNIPPKFLRNLAEGDEWKRRLCATTLNEFSYWTESKRFMFRIVGDEVRGVLSDSYRRLNAITIISAFIEEVSSQNAKVVNAYMNDTKVWCETLLPTPIQVPTKNNGIVVIFAGARFSTSDYGDGSVDMRSFLLNGACLNGMVRETVMKQIHLGSKLPDNIALSDETYRLDTATTASAVKDLTKNLYSADTIRTKTFEIQTASEMEVDLTHELNGLVKKGSLLKNEGKEVETLLMNNNPNDGVSGAATLWKLTQGINAYGRNLELQDDPKRARELQELSGELMNRVKKIN